MTFTPSVLSKNDPNNTATLTGGSTFYGIWTGTTGYNTIQINIKRPYVPVQTTTIGKLEVQFSSDSSTITYTYTDICSSACEFIKRYNVLDAYYRVVFTPEGTPDQSDPIEITPRLCTNSLNQETKSISAFDNNSEALIDSFGKLRVTNPYTVLDIKFPGQTDGSGSFLSNQLQLCSKFTGTGGATGSSVSSNGYTVIQVIGSGTWTSQSRKYCVYQAGKSLLVNMSGIIMPTNGTNATPIAGCIGRIGYFDDSNGLYFEYNDTGISVCLKSQGTVVSQIYSVNWNIDSMNGTGTSGINLNFAKSQLFVIDFEWLGVGRIRFGFFIFGRVYYCHEITNINQLTIPYMVSPNLPIRYQLVGASSTTSQITQICSTVISEGGYSPVGRPFVAPGSQMYSLALAANTETGLIAIRGGGSNYYHQNILPSTVNVVDSSNGNVGLWRLRLFLDLTGISVSSWNSADLAYSVVQYATNSTTLSTSQITSFTAAKSIVVAQGYFYGRGTISFADLTGIFSQDLLQITSDVDGNSSILLLTCTTNGNNSTVYYDIAWNEIY